MVKEEWPDFDVCKTTQKDAKKMPIFHERVNRGKQNTYLFEVRGREEDRAPIWLKEFMGYPTPDPWLTTVKDDHYLSYAETKKLQRMGVATDERFLISIPKGKSSESGEELDMEIKKEVGYNIWQIRFVFMSRKCRICGKPRFISYD